MEASEDDATPELGAVRALRRQLGDLVRTTPVLRWTGPSARDAIGDTAAHLKLELFQHAGSFKLRGALAVLLELDRDALDRGVTAVSAGNHAMAVAYAAGLVGTSAKVVMPSNANPARVEGCRALGAEIVLVPDVAAAFAAVEAIVAEEGRTFVHPFEGPRTALGTATLALEFIEQLEAEGIELDAMLVPIGGGGLAAGVATATKLLRPRCEVFGIEPIGADTMHRSFHDGAPASIDRVRTIADSLGAPHAAPYSYGLCRRYLDELVAIDDDDLRRAMRLLFTHLHLAVEPAGAAATAALLGPLRERLAGRQVGVIVCGANIDPETFHAHLNSSGPRLP